MSSTTKTPAPISQGQRVKIDDKPSRIGDQKTIAYYPFYTGLTGTVLHTYPDGSSSVDIDQDSLPVAIRKRHEKSESQLREKWLGDSAEDDPNLATTGKVRGLKLRYMLLVANDDMVPFAGPAPEAKPAPSTEVAAASEPTATTTGRLSLEEIESAEQAHLEEIRRRAENT